MKPDTSHKTRDTETRDYSTKSLQTRDYLTELKQEAAKYFQATGFPTSKNEAWKYTNVQPLLKDGFEPVTEKTQLKEAPHFDNIIRLKANRLVFIDGFFAEEHSEIIEEKDKLLIAPLSQYFENHELPLDDFGKIAASENDGFTALNTASFSDGAYINIPKNTALENPVLLYFISTGEQQERVSMPRNLVVAGESSQCSIIECFQNLSTGKAATNAVTEIRVHENAQVEYCKIMSRAAHYSHIGTTAVRLERNSRFSAWSLTFGGDLVRHNLNVRLNDENCETHLYGLYVVSGNDHVDNHVTVDHAKPHCQSNQLYKGLLNGASSGAFSGKIIVREDAQKTNAFQSNKNILLSKDATINSKPMLEIFADDVKCSHGSTSGQMDDEAVFYLRSRGISEQHAKNILHQAFAWDVIDKISNAELKDYLNYVLMIGLNR